MFELDYLANHPELIQPVAELGQLEFGYLNPGRTIENRLESLKKHLNYDQLPIAFVGFKDGKFIGTASLRITDIDSYTHVTPWLGGVIVVPEMRNQGVGTWLVEETMKQALNLGVHTWYLYTPNRETFYAKMGWKTIDKTSHNNVPGVVMQFAKEL